MTDDFLAGLRTAYDGGAQRRDARGLPPWRLAERAAFADRLRAAGARRLLEVGAGPGHDSAFFADSGFDVVATDLSPEMVRLCRAKGLDARATDVLGLSFEPASFDAAYTVNCLQHVPDADLPAALDRIADVLRPAGLLYLGVWTVEGPDGWSGTLDSDDHLPKRLFFLRTDEQLRAYVSARFDVVDVRRIPVAKEWPFQAMTLRLAGPGLAGPGPAGPGPASPGLSG